MSYCPKTFIRDCSWGPGLWGGGQGSGIGQQKSHEAPASPRGGPRVGEQGLCVSAPQQSVPDAGCPRQGCILAALRGWLAEGLLEAAAPAFRRSPSFLKVSGSRIGACHRQQIVKSENLKNAKFWSLKQRKLTWTAVKAFHYQHSWWELRDLHVLSVRFTMLLNFCVCYYI